jgi:hypothetical protein
MAKELIVTCLLACIQACMALLINLHLALTGRKQQRDETQAAA